MKKFIVRDEDNKEFEVEEIEEVQDEMSSTTDEAASLSEDEIAALKKLAGVADKLVALIDIEKDEHADEPESEMLDEDEDEEEVEEEIVDTEEEIEEKVTRKDSKKSVGSIERRKSHDSDDSIELDINEAWKNRYGGSK